MFRSHYEHVSPQKGEGYTGTRNYQSSADEQMVHIEIERGLSGGPITYRSSFINIEVVAMSRVYLLRHSDNFLQLKKSQETTWVEIVFNTVTT